MTLGLEKLDIEVAAYSEFHSNAIGNTHAAYVIYGDAADMTETISWVQSELTFDGETIFDGADLTEIQAMLDGTSATMPVQVQMNEYTVDDWADMGLESEEEWIVPPLDHSVTWEPEYFQFPLHKEFAIQQFDEGDAAIQLQAPGFSGWAYVNIGPNVDDRTIQDWGDHWASEEWTGYQNYSFPALDSGVNQTNAAYVDSMQGDNNTTIIAIRDSVFLPDGNLAILTIETTADRASQMYMDAIESIAINGQHLEPSYTVAEIELIIATSTSDSDQPTLAHHVVRSTMATFGIRQTFSENCRLVYLPLQ